MQPDTSDSVENAPVIDLYRQLHRAWNNQNAVDFAALFADDGLTIGFDGSEMIGQNSAIWSNASSTRSSIFDASSPALRNWIVPTWASCTLSAS